MIIVARIGLIACTLCPPKNEQSISLFTYFQEEVFQLVMKTNQIILCWRERLQCDERQYKFEVN